MKENDEFMSWEDLREFGQLGVRVSLEVGREVGPSRADLGVIHLEQVAEQQGPRRGAKGRYRKTRNRPLRSALEGHEQRRGVRKAKEKGSEKQGDRQRLTQLMRALPGTSGRGRDKQG